MLKQNIIIPEGVLTHFCQRHHIRKLSFFGSILGDKFQSESIVDILVEFDPDHMPGFDFFSMQEELSQIIGRLVELHTPNFLSPHFREDVVQNAQVIYAAT